MRLSSVVHLIGVILRLFGFMLAAPLAVSLLYGETRDAAGFAVTGIATVLAGHLMRQGRRGVDDELRRVEALAVVSGTWLVAAVAGAGPYLWVGVTPVDAFFESMSGLTTTGATIFEDFGAYGRGVFFWRALTQWLGGMGIITLFIAVLPRLAIAGRQLFFAEAPGPTDQKLTPQTRRTAALLWRVYGGLTAAEFAALMLAGMPAYDAACHALTTLSAGGFSPHPLSIMGYESAAVEWIVIGFMFLAGANFALQYRVLLGRPLALLRDAEFRTYSGIVAVATALLFLSLWGVLGDGLLALRQCLFQALTILTTTGYASADFQLWNDQSRIVLLGLMFFGGCAGSAAGGPKVVRLLLITRYVRHELKRTLHPKAVLPVKLGSRVVPDDIMRAVLVFFVAYLLLFALCALVVAGFGSDLVTAVTAAIAALGNIGPGLNAVGPMANYAHLPDVSKVVLIGAMWIGRLEVLTVLALLRPEVWRMARWSGSSA
jgi:trk system potassium uptake protein